MDRQGQAIDGGLRIFTEDNLYHTGRKFIAESGIGVPSQFITDPTKLPPVEPQENPETVKAQVDGQTTQQREAQGHEQAMGRLALQGEEQRESLRMKADTAAADAQIKQGTAELDAQLKRDKADFEANLARERADREFALAREKMERELALRQNTGDNSGVLPTFRPGGDLDR